MSNSGGGDTERNWGRIVLKLSGEAFAGGQDFGIDQSGQGVAGVIVRCGTCLNLRIFTPAHALKLFGAATCVDDIPARCRCKCGAKAKHAVANWPRRSRGGSDPQPIVPKEWGRLP